MKNVTLEQYLKFFHIALPFAIINGVVWGVGVMTLPILAKTSAKAGLTFAMINLGIGVGAIIWSRLSHKFKVKNLIFASSLLSFFGWLAIVVLNGRCLVPLALIFGIFAAGIFALASVIVTNTYEKKDWDRYISLMQAFMTLGTVIGLLVTSIYSNVIIGIPFLIIAFLSYIPISKKNSYIAKHHTLHFNLLKPKMHFSEALTGYFYNRFKIKHFIHLKDKRIMLLNLSWIFSLLAAAPVYAMYPLLMKRMFFVNSSVSSIVYATSTALGVYFFIFSGKMSERRSPLVSFNTGLILYFASFAIMFAGIKANTPLLGILGFIIMIIAWSFLSVGMNISIVTFADKTKRAELLGVANTFQSFDNVAGGFLGGLIASIFGYYYVIVFGMIFAFSSIVIGFFLFIYQKSHS